VPKAPQIIGIIDGPVEPLIPRPSSDDCGIE
jgi:hypothetical protein